MSNISSFQRDGTFVTGFKMTMETQHVSRNLGRYAPKFLAPAEGWWPSATDWQGLNFFYIEKIENF